MQTAYLLPLTALSLVLAVGALGFRANGRRGYGPLILGVVAAVGLAAGKFVVDSNLLVYGGVAALVGASLWNAWPKSTKRVPPAPTEPLLQPGGAKEEK
jgi:hypothetical protein